IFDHYRFPPAECLPDEPVPLAVRESVAGNQILDDSRIRALYRDGLPPLRFHLSNLGNVLADRIAPNPDRTVADTAVDGPARISIRGLDRRVLCEGRVSSRRRRGFRPKTICPRSAWQSRAKRLRRIAARGLPGVLGFILLPARSPTACGQCVWSGRRNCW